MSAAPRVSCIMIFRDAERFMEEAVASVFAQSDSSWELLLVDDGSVDGSTHMARAWAARHPERVRHLEHPRHENRGMSASRNLGLAHARGELVAFLDADDVWLPFKLAFQTAILDAHPAVDMVYGPSEYWYGWTGDPADVRRDHYGDLGVAPETAYEAPRLLVHALENAGATMPGICSLLVRRDAVLRVGGFEEAFRGCYEDQVFLCKLFLHGTVFVTGVASDRYRQHPWSACARANRSGEYHPALPHRARRVFLDWLRWYLEAEEVNDPAVLVPLRQNLLPYDHPILHGSRMRARWALQRVRRVLVRVLRRVLPGGVYRWLRARRHAGQWVPPVGLVRFGSLRRLAPVSRAGGAERGRPIDEHFVRESVAAHADAVHGRVLEFASDRARVACGAAPSLYTHVPAGDGALQRLAELPDDYFDAVVCAHGLQRVYDVRAAVRELRRVLKPGGALVVTVPGAGSIGAPSAGATYWGFTALSVRALFEEVFPVEMLRVETRGSVLTATALLNGIAAEELRANELAHRDADYPVVLTVRAEKPTAAWERGMLGRWAYGTAAAFPYGDDTTYRKGVAFLDGHGPIEDWGAGTGWARRFVRRSAYRGVDGSANPTTDHVADLRGYRSEAACILMRHVLEHNREWERILDNALCSFRRRMVLVIFTPFATSTREIASWSGIPDIAFRKEDLLARLGEFLVAEESIESATQYGREHVFYLERRRHLRAIA